MPETKWLHDAESSQRGGRMKYLAQLQPLTALLMLVVEAAAIGDRTRLGPAKEAAIEQMGILEKDKSFRRVKDDVKYAIDENCLKLEMTRYSFITLHNGLPSSWKSLHQLNISHQECEKLLKRADPAAKG